MCSQWQSQQDSHSLTFPLKVQHVFDTYSIYTVMYFNQLPFLPHVLVDAELGGSAFQGWKTLRFCEGAELCQNWTWL